MKALVALRDRPFFDVASVFKNTVGLFNYSLHIEYAAVRSLHVGSVSFFKSDRGGMVSPLCTGRLIVLARLFQSLRGESPPAGGLFNVVAASRSAEVVGYCYLMVTCRTKIPLYDFG
jgi:hypothetical protein